MFNKTWVDCVLAKGSQLPHPGELHKGCRIYIPEAKLLVENDGTVWRGTILQSGDEFADLFNGNVVKV